MFGVITKALDDIFVAEQSSQVKYSDLARFVCFPIDMFFMLSYFPTDFCGTAGRQCGTFWIYVFWLPMGLEGGLPISGSEMILQIETSLKCYLKVSDKEKLL